MRHVASALLKMVFAPILLMPLPAMAGMSEEVAHLLAFIATSPCAFIRNGVAHGGTEAAAHMKRKYDHYREDIGRAEDFIALAATRSELSGRPYLVECGGKMAPAAEWLLQELNAFRRRS
jgi:hypothetical protein